MSSSTHRCPVCASSMTAWSEHPNMVCGICVERVTAENGRRLRFGSLGPQGGVVGHYLDDGSPHRGVLCFIDGQRCIALAAAFGSVVVEVHDPERHDGRPSLPPPSPLDPLPSAYIPLLGAALGDGLGAGVEGQHALSRALQLDGPAVGREFLPYSPFGFQPGELTDDTQMVLAALLAEGPPPPLDHPADRRLFLRRRLDAYLGWYRSGPPDVGVSTSLALNQGRPDGGWRSWAGGQSAGNGSLMRAVGALVEGYRGPDLVLATALDSALTHPDPLCIAGCVLANTIAEAAIRRDDPSAFDAVVGEACDGLESLAPTFLDAFSFEEVAWRRAFEARWASAKRTMVDRALSALSGAHVDCERSPFTDWPTGFVVDTWGQAVWSAAHGEMAADCVHLAVRHGGHDADTIGAIAGALAAARFGRRSLSNWKWQETSELRLGHDLAGHPRGYRFIDLLRAHLGRGTLPASSG